MARPRGSINKLCEQALAIFDEFERQYKFEPLAELLAVSLEQKSKPRLNNDDYRCYVQTLRALLEYKIPKLKSLDISTGEESMGNNFISLLNAIKECENEEKKAH